MEEDKKLLEEAISFIVDREERDDFICEQMVDMDSDWCPENCENLQSECVIRFLKNRIKEKNTND